MNQPADQPTNQWNVQMTIWQYSIFRRSISTHIIYLHACMLDNSLKWIDIGINEEDPWIILYSMNVNEQKHNHDSMNVSDDKEGVQLYTVNVS